MRAALFVVPLLLASFGLAATAHAKKPARAASPAAVAEPEADDHVQQAEEQFRHARELYQAGRYGEARQALLEARALDPNAKDLVLNLGIVSEKMQEFDAAIEYLQQYQAMADVTDAERQRADASIRRIEGARDNAPKPAVWTPAPPEPKVLLKEAPQRGRVDGWTVTALGVTAAAIASGATFSVLALTADPGAEVRTGKNYSWQQVQDDQRQARTFGVVADISFGVGIAAAATSAILYFARTKTTAPRTAAFVPGTWKVEF